MEKKIVKGDFFIIPNMPENVLAQISKSCPQVAENRKKNLESFVGRTISLDESMVQIWATSPESDNWECHRHPEIENFPTWLPAKELEGVKEGDTITLHQKDTIIELTAKQLEYRYRKYL